MQNTKNYSLLLPDGTDFYNVDDYNANFEAIDTQMKSNQTKADNVTANHNSHVANKSNPHGVTKGQVGLGNVPNVTTNNQTPTYTVPGTATELVSGETVTNAFGKLARAVSSLISHIGNKSNPHGVTKAQIGLGSVPNVSTNDQTPTYSDTTTLATLTSGEKLNVALQKVKLAITTLISHVANVSNPHSVTKAQVGLGNCDNTADSGKVVLSASKLTTARAISLTGDVTGTVNFDGSAAVSIAATVSDDSHNHIISNVDGLQTALDSKVGIVSGKGLSTNDYTTTEKNKLAGIAAGAQVNTITGVKGNAETSYRTGQVNITPANIGLGNVNNTADSAKSVLYAATAGGVAWGNVTGKPSTFPAASHTHDDRYYTETEIDTMMSQKVHIGTFANGRLSLQWIDTTSHLKAFIDGVEIGSFTITK